MAISLSKLVKNLAEGIQKIKYKYEHYDKNVKLAELNTKTVTAFLNKQTFIDLIEYQYLCYNKNYQKCLIKT